MDLCNFCEDNAQNKATHHCYECKLNLCDACLSDVHRIKAFRGHSPSARVTMAEYHKYNDDYIPTDEDHNNDVNNVYIGVDDIRKLIQPGPRFHTLHEIKDDDFLPIVSMVGPTGTGKSLLMRLFCKEGCVKPLASNPQSTESTSSDIHAYIGDFPTAKAPTVLMLDSEGINGTVPSSIRFNFKWLSDFRELFTVRKPFVNRVFPRLLYMFSSVFCFVFNGSPKEQQTWTKYIRTYGSQAAASTVNQHTLPTLIIVFNKVTIEEGVWDVTEATAKFDFSSFTTLYSDVKVIYIPDRKGDRQQYVTQAKILQEVIATNINNHALYTKKSIMQLFSIALPEFSKDPYSVFNFMDLLMRNWPLPSDFHGRMWHFFCSIIQTDTEADSRNQVTYNTKFKKAVSLLSERLVDSFQIHLWRGNINTTCIPDDLVRFAHILETKVASFRPCMATNEFPQVGVVSCSSIDCNHGSVHQSNKTYTEEVPKQGFLAALFGSTTTVTQACRWEGEFQPHKKHSSHGWFAKSLTIKPHVSPEAFLLECKKLLASHYKAYEQVDSLVCIGCILGPPTEVLMCGHELCLACCEDFQTDGTTQCPFCNCVGTWTKANIPEGAGTRAIAIDGGGVRGIISSILLQTIEEWLDIPLFQLFDLIIGVSVGGLHALGFGVLKKSGSDVVETFKEIIDSTLTKKLLGSKLLGWLYYGYQHQCKPLHDILAKLFPNTCMLGQVPRVTVVASKMSTGKPELCLLTSCQTGLQICTAEDKVTGIVYFSPTTLTVAEATTAAGTYFPIFESPEGIYADGSILCGNPCYIAYTETKRIWADKPLDFILSVGSGTSHSNNHWQKNGSPFHTQMTLAVIEAYKAWEELQEVDEAAEKNGKSYRLDPPLNHDFPMDDFENLQKYEQFARDYIKANPGIFDHICNTLLAKLFYVAPPVSMCNDECVMVIKSRILVPQTAKLTSAAFSVKTDGTDNVKAKSVVISREEIRIEMSGIPEKGDLEVQVLCHLAHNATISDLGIPISGFPWKISRDAAKNKN